MVSVIVICYNQENSIARALDSVLRQDSSVPFEIVIGDDASTDSTRAICQEYAVRHPDIIRLLPEEPNLGLVGNYFRCLKVCRGEYISDCAGDDEWLGTHRISDAMKIFESYPGVNVVYSDYIIFDTRTGESRQAYSSDDEARRRAPVFKGERLLRKALNRTDSLPYVLSSAVFRLKDLLEVMNEYPGMVCNGSFGCEDVPVIAALASKGDAAFNPAVTLKYNLVENSISNNSDRLKSARFYLKSLRMSRILGKHYGISEKKMADTFQTKSLYVSSAAFDLNDKTLAQSVKKEISSWSLKPSLKCKVYLNLGYIKIIRNAIRAIKHSLNRH